MIKVVRAKLHCIRVTDANLNYQGSITLDPEQCEAVGIYPLEFVDIWNKNSGARISTYVIYGERGSRCCVLNGSAARTCQPGDEVIIAASLYCQPAEIATLKPRVLTFLPDNRIDKTLVYDVTALSGDRFDFAIREDAFLAPEPA
ncbi:aspartate 1-decarboxylase [Azospirillum rugosum]|uniref:Aspartate 1-decarboxylase n=1 Tax=Azospirillum rugosum TaxID=416170 RepID=A0ABS4SUX1_9PROT|nr:aspartate 1-decarboxylase [Azospirillum rugosum]MDQ0529881.1 aspartate 1-decarboxylase [Azospirillum rugosum]